jgi:hypothetical protein
LGGNGDGFVHSNRCNAGCFLAQDVSDLHRNLLQMSRRTSLVLIILVYIMPIVNREVSFAFSIEGRKKGRNTDVLLRSLEPQRGRHGPQGCH